jgi:hypothetical protein
MGQLTTLQAQYNMHAENYIGQIEVANAINFNTL